MEPRPPKPSVPLPCRACSAPLGWFTADRRRLKVAPNVSATPAPAGAVAGLQCACGEQRLLKGATALFVALDW